MILKYLHATKLHAKNISNLIQTKIARFMNFELD